MENALIKENVTDEEIREVLKSLENKNFVEDMHPMELLAIAMDIYIYSDGGEEVKISSKTPMPARAPEQPVVKVKKAAKKEKGRLVKAATGVSKVKKAQVQKVIKPPKTKQAQVKKADESPRAEIIKAKKVIKPPGPKKATTKKIDVSLEHKKVTVKKVKETPTTEKSKIKMIQMPVKTTKPESAKIKEPVREEKPRAAKVIKGRKVIPAPIRKSKKPAAPPKNEAESVKAPAMTKKGLIREKERDTRVVEVVQTQRGSTLKIGEIREIKRDPENEILAMEKAMGEEVPVKLKAGGKVVKEKPEVTKFAKEEKEDDDDLISIALGLFSSAEEDEEEEEVKVEKTSTKPKKDVRKSRRTTACNNAAPGTRISRNGPGINSGFSYEPPSLNSSTGRDSTRRRLNYGLGYESTWSGFRGPEDGFCQRD